jgi:hypothetical protein
MRVCLCMYVCMYVCVCVYIIIYVHARSVTPSIGCHPCVCDFVCDFSSEEKFMVLSPARVPQDAARKSQITFFTAKIAAQL